MGITRDIIKPIQGLDSERSIITCSTADQIFIATNNVNVASTSINGRIIDRLDIELGARYLSVEPVAWLYASRGSTAADRFLSLAIRLQHGDSSGGGDMSDYFGPSTGTQPGVQGVARNFFATARTSDMSAWSTGGFFGQTNAGVLDIRGAKRYVRAVVVPGKSKTTTESSGDEGMRVGALLNFGAGDEIPENTNTTGQNSTSSST